MYLNLVQIAESFGVSEKVVEEWIRTESLPHTPDRGRLLFDRAEVANWASARGLVAQAGFLAPQNTPFATGWKLAALLRTGGIWRDVPASDVIETLARIIARLPGASPASRRLLTQRLLAPGGVTFAPVGSSFALPHLSTRAALGRESGTVGLLLLRTPLALPEPSPDEVPVTNLIFFLAPSPRAHLDLLGRLSRLIGRESARERITRGGTDEEIFRVFEQADAVGGKGDVR